MKKVLFGLSVPALFAVILICFPFKEEKSVQTSSEREIKLPVPNDHWTQVRSYPFGFDQEEYLSAIQSVAEDANTPSNKAIILTSPWMEEGPGNIGGRFNCLTTSPTDPNIIYAGAANGGIFKTIDGGANWTPLFDALAYLAIGEIEIDPNDENTIYVGTGDRNFGGGSHIGNGVYRSTDAGVTWSQIGLGQTGIVTEIAIDPTNSNRIFVSTLGNTYEKTTERGVYRSTDGGTSWQNVLFISDSSGVVDLVMDPSDPNVLYASGYNRINLPFQAKVTGPDAKIYKTVDGGDNWTVLSNGLPVGEQSRIGLAVSDADPNHVYALYVDGVTLDVLDVYESTDAGSNWTPMNVHTGGLSTSAMGGFGWYFGQLHINPYDNNTMLIEGVDLWLSTDGGSTWVQNVPNWWTYEVHADKHAVLFLDATSYIIATDGGLYKTTNNGVNWTNIENMPVTQFYHIDVDRLNPGIYGGGAQDNGSMSGNSFSFNNWDKLYGGDGFRQTWLYQDIGGAYFETQNGGLSYENSINFSSQNVSVTASSPDRVNWDMPYLVTEIDETYSELFVGTSKMQLMDFAPWGSYVDISGDLTKVATGNYVGWEKYHNITEMEMSYYNLDKIYVGTSDGMVWRGERNSPQWDWIDITGTLPDRYVTAVKASPNFDSTVYVAFSGYKLNEAISYLYKSEDDGQTWIDISSNLPGITVNDVLVIPGYDDEYIFAALDGGVYFTSDGGGTWDYVGTGLPLATISELDLDVVNQKLIAGTYSRSMWSYDISWIDDLTEAVAKVEEAQIEPVLFYPNPVSDLVYFNLPGEDYLDLYDVNGNIVIHKKIIPLNGYQQANLSSLAAGTYFYRSGQKQGKLIKK